ncbi:unnamed protein product [Polarella glacialis]|uniref:Altered inheritance of mitochondria protein 24, mitochondrial n=1 Tax=Polarella glacialis TaxID=89957 RepID=A0A813JSG6_POLGL|nr:unnamed protein product [Polarella glacialis]
MFAALWACLLGSHCTGSSVWFLQRAGDAKLLIPSTETTSGVDVQVWAVRLPIWSLTPSDYVATCAAKFMKPVCHGSEHCQWADPRCIALAMEAPFCSDEKSALGGLALDLQKRGKVPKFEDALAGTENCSMPANLCSYEPSNPVFPSGLCGGYWDQCHSAGNLVEGPRYAVCAGLPGLPKTADVFLALQGTCVVEGQCVTSPRQVSFLSGPGCEVLLLRPGTLEVEHSESAQRDGLRIRGTTYRGSQGAASVTVDTGDTIEWMPDSNVTDGGWKMCWQSLPQASAELQHSRSNDAEVATRESATHWMQNASNASSAHAQEARDLRAAASELRFSILLVLGIVMTSIWAISLFLAVSVSQRISASPSSTEPLLPEFEPFVSITRYHDNAGESRIRIRIEGPACRLEAKCLASIGTRVHLKLVQNLGHHSLTAENVTQSDRISVLLTCTPDCGRAWEEVIKLPGGHWQLLQPTTGCQDPAVLEFHLSPASSPKPSTGAGSCPPVQSAHLESTGKQTSCSCADRQDTSREAEDAASNLSAATGEWLLTADSVGDWPDESD